MIGFVSHMSHCNTLQHAATHCNTTGNTFNICHDTVCGLQRIGFVSHMTHCNILQKKPATHCNTRQFIPNLTSSCGGVRVVMIHFCGIQRTEFVSHITHCNTLQKKSTCNTLQHRAIHSTSDPTSRGVRVVMLIFVLCR